MKAEYVNLIQLIERLHRRFLDLLRAELNRVGMAELNGVQALLLANIGSEDIVIRDLIERGYYQGSNVSYNIKKLTELGYLSQERAAHDRRSVRVTLTEKALEVVRVVRELETRNADALVERGMSAQDLDGVCRALRRVELTWVDYIHDGRFSGEF